MPGPANKKAAKKRQMKKKKQEKAKAHGGTLPIQDGAASVSTPLEISQPSDRVPDYEPANEEKQSIEIQYTELVDGCREEEARPWVEPQDFQSNDDFRDETESEPGAIGVYDDEDEEGVYEGGVEMEEPCVFDPGNGPRVRNFVGFMKSAYAVAQETSFGADLLRTASASTVIPLLTRILPGEFATVMWYNRTRTTHRVCPACQRIYHLGEALRPHVKELEPDRNEDPDYESDRQMTKQERLAYAEQWRSGICSFPCYALATYNYGMEGILAYGLPWQDLDDAIREVLEGEGLGIDDQGLSHYIRVSRLDPPELCEAIGI
ncbi:hypothetical protein CPB86DRAFT_796705 [Serendipita vermifera]|nr:hypothetical protein CPB86DRAFT_796705 [Serendipita vermifera]